MKLILKEEILIPFHSTAIHSPERVKSSVPELGHLSRFCNSSTFFYCRFFFRPTRALSGLTSLAFIHSPAFRALTVMRRTINPFTTIYYTKGQVASILVQIQFVSTLLSSETVLLALAYKVKSQVSYLKKLNFSSSTVKSELPSSLLITDFFELLAD
ncbi:hypothetical protein VNO77_51128 [Canavalia gladiata]|uniref:Uncharacterized protein n=1 Tax=Canavalia gladiata TaxID=3824 RepID=A0AAN9PGA8_CANGL